MKVLFVNDDGIECPLVTSLLKEVKKVPWISEISAVVPAFEKSWIGSAVSRDVTISCHEIEYDGVRVFVADGTPADCVSLAFSGLPIARPDLVISGLNAGMNTSVAFAHSSGTLNGAKFAALHGVPGIALSMLVNPEMKNAWNVRDYATLEKFKGVFDGINKYFLKASKAVIDAGLLSGENAVAHYCSLNSHYELQAHLPPVLTSPSNNRLAPMFEKVGPNLFKHKFSGFDEGFIECLPHKPNLPDDMKVLFDKRATLSLFRLDYDYGNLNLPLDCAERMLKAWAAL